MGDERAPARAPAGVSRFGLIFWSLIAACGAAAIVSGFASDARNAPRPAPHPSPRTAPASPVPLPTFRGSDTFGADWDVVVDRSPAPDPDGRARIAIAVGPCGANAALDAAFAHLDLPIALVIDPAGADAVAAAGLARSQGKPFYVQVGRAPSPAKLASLLKKFQGAAGLASDAGRAMPAVLSGSGLAYFDERGDVDPAPFSKTGTPLIRRDLSVDDRDATGYVDYMLQRAVALGAGRGRAVALMHPRAASLQALRAFARSNGRDLVAFAP